MMPEANRDAAPTPVGAGARPSEAFPLVVERVSKGYDVDGKFVPVIGDLSLSLDKGEIVSIVGPSGCGKTTLLNTLCGLIAPDAGRIRWYGRELAGQQQNVGYMLQKDLLLPWRTALGNVMLGQEIRGVAAGEAHDRSRAMLDRLGLHGFADHYPSTLSGGMRQRVALARTLVNEPSDRLGVAMAEESAVHFQLPLDLSPPSQRLAPPRLALIQLFSEAVSTLARSQLDPPERQ